MSKKKATQTSVRQTAGKGDALLSAEERAAMRETLNERRRARSGKVDGESDVLAKIAEMAKPDRVIAERIHSIVKPRRRLSVRKRGTECPHMRRTARSSASSRAEPSSSQGTRPSVSSRTQTSMTVTFGLPLLQ